MASDPAYDLGYAAVDAQSNTGHLLATMDDVSRWPAVLALRTWTRDRLALRPGQRLLDVGCGPGDAAVALAADLGADGEVVGVDASAAMLVEAGRRAADVRCSFRTELGDAMALDLPDRSFDAARAERTLQWVPDPAAAVAELHRVLRPGGRVALIDTDWSTLLVDTGDDRVGAAVRAGMQSEQRRPSNVGGRLLNLCRDVGFVGLQTSAATHVWTRWDPDGTAVPDGFFSIESLAEDLVERGSLDVAGVGHFIASIKDAARRDHLFMALTMFAVAGRRA